METKELFTDHNELAVDELLHFYYEIQEGQGLRGDYGATELLLDLEEAIENAELTEAQAEYIHLVYMEDMTFVTAAKHKGVTKQAVEKTIKVAIRKIANTYKGDVL